MAVPFSNEIDEFRQSKYDFNYLVFPDNVGMDDNRHYMIININAPTDTEGNYKGDLNRGNIGYAAGYGNLATRLDPREFSKVDQMYYGPKLNMQGYQELRKWINDHNFLPDWLTRIFGSVTDFLGLDPSAVISMINNASRKRNTRRIVESIALYMSSPLVFSTQNVYEDISLTALGAKLLTSNPIAQKALSFIPGSRSILPISQVLKTPINPSIEVLYANTLQRSFVFEFLLAPRNERESIAAEKIIKTLRYHAAPDRGGNFTADNFGALNSFLNSLPIWTPPAEFDISFYASGKENRHILRISTCALEKIEVDYTPSGIYSTFSNGYPVMTRLSLAFRELEVIDKSRVIRGF